MPVYSYLLRPVYGSSELLIEFPDPGNFREFSEVLFEVLSPLEPGIVQSELLLAETMLFTLRSRMGPFTLSHDTFNLVFIMADDNQPVLHEADRLLQQDARFCRLEADFDAYRIS